MSTRKGVDVSGASPAHVMGVHSQADVHTENIGNTNREVAGPAP